MATNGTEDRSGREIRLLLLVIAVAVAGLLVLARFRFPEAEIVSVTPTPNPLDRLAARAPFDDLAAAVSNGTAHVAPWLAVVDLERTPEKPAKKAAAPPAPVVPQQLLVLGLRVRPDLVVAYAPEGWTATMVAGTRAQAFAADPQRQIALFSTDRSGEPGVPNADVADFASAVSAFAGSTYVLAAEPAARGAAVQPIFIPRVDALTVEHWAAPLLQIGGEPHVPAGAFLFTIDGRLIGLALPVAGGIGIVDAATLDRLVGELTSKQ